MEKHEECYKEAGKKIRLADHMLATTYPLLKDPKLLLTVLENLYSGLDLTMTSLVYYERLWKRIPPFHDTFDVRFQIFSTQLARKLSIPPQYIQLISTVRELVATHKKAPVEFARKDRFVMASDQYSLKTLSEKDLKNHLSTAKNFYRDLFSLLNRHDVRTA